MSDGLTIKQLCEQSHALSISKGWWDGKLGADESFVPEKLMLIVSEASEALECYRVGDMAPAVADGGKPEGFPSELADVLIRVGDLAQRLGIDLERAVREKHEYNATRAHRHGGKVC